MRQAKLNIKDAKSTKGAGRLDGIVAFVPEVALVVKKYD